MAAVGRHGDPDQLFVRCADVFKVQPEAREARRTVGIGLLGFEHDIGARDQLCERLLAGCIFQVEFDAALAGVVMPRPEAPSGAGLVVEKGRIVARGIAARRLHKDHIGAEVRKEFPRIGDSLVRELDNANSRHWSLAQITPPARISASSASE